MDTAFDFRIFFLYVSIRPLLAFVLDAIFGEPRFLSYFHPVVLIGKLISFLEFPLRAVFPKNPRGEFFSGLVLVFFVCLISFLIPFSLLFLLFRAFFRFQNPAFVFFALALDLFWGYQSVAARALFDEARNVLSSLEKSIFQGQKALSRIVGRDTKLLSIEGILSACVETVAEGTTDGVFSPLIFFALGGSPLSLFFKAISTLDSMIGYKNARYFYFGKVAARLDDIANFFGARLCAFFLLFSAFVFRVFGFRTFHPILGVRVFFRDRNKHESPNSAQSESAVAGILGIQLGGGAFYGGKWETRDFLGNALRKIEKKDVLRACALLYASSAFFVLFFCALFFAFRNVIPV